MHYGNGLSVPYSISGSTYTAPAGIFDTLVKNVDNTYTLTTKDQTKYHFNTTCFCDSITDRNGNAITITLDTNNYATAITDPNGRKITINATYDGTKRPQPGYDWRGKGEPGSGSGNWYNPSTGESLHPDLAHPDPIGPHWDYKDPDGQWWRLFPGGTTESKGQ